MDRRGLLLASAALAGCATAPQQGGSLPPGLLDQPAPAGGRLWQLDVQASRLRAIAFRAGAMGSRVGHHHILQAGEARGRLWLPAQGLAGAQGEIAIPLAALLLDEPSWRREAGGEFDEKPLSAEDRAATRRNLLNSLRAEQHPELRLQLRTLSGAAPWWVAELAVQLAGRAALQRLPLVVRRDGERLLTAGRFVIRHSEHGLQAFSLLGGLLAIADEIVVEAELDWR
jgi:hypothetical protein